MKPSPGENKFGDSCGMHGLRFSDSPDGHLPPPTATQGSVEPGNDATDGSRTGEADSSSVICWLVRGHVCAWIAGVDSVRTITADSLEFLPLECYSRCSVGASPWPWVRIAA